MSIREYILMVAEERSFSKAARKLYISQPALSAAVIRYEKEIGVALFDRSQSPLMLTEAGEAYIQAAKEILQIETHLSHYFSDLSELQAGSLSIGGTFFISSCFLPYFVSAFLNRYPKIQLKLVEGASQELEQMAISGQIDLLIDSKSYNPEVFTGIPLMEDHIFLAVPKENPINQMLIAYQLTVEDILEERYLSKDFPALPLEKFAEEPFLLLNPGNNMYERAMRLCAKAGFMPKVALSLDQLMLTYYMTTMGIGASFVTSVLVKYSNFRKHPVYYKINDEEAVRKIVIAYRKNRYQTKAMEAFLEILHRKM